MVISADPRYAAGARRVGRFGGPLTRLTGPERKKREHLQQAGCPSVAEPAALQSLGKLLRELHVLLFHM